MSLRPRLVINDHLELALECGAHGLHLGQDDGSLQEARARIGPEMLLGRSTHSLRQARQALADSADYIGFGPLFPYLRPKKVVPGIGLGKIRAMQRRSRFANPGILYWWNQAWQFSGSEAGRCPSCGNCFSLYLSSPVPKEETPKTFIPTLMKILVGGSVAIDNVKTPVADETNLLGGSASYASLAAAKLASSVHLLGIIGNDFPQEHLEMLSEQGVDLSGLERSGAGLVYLDR